MRYAWYYGYIISVIGVILEPAARKYRDYSTKEIQAVLVEATRPLGYSKLRSN